jgi:hypothetical protein
MKKTTIILSVILLMIILPFETFSQCKGYTRRHCKSQIQPYVFNGQLNSAVMSEGDVAELILTLYTGQNYRIFVCSQELLGNVEFVLLDSEKNIIFNNKDHDYVKYWDFTSEVTQQLTVQVKIPATENISDIIQSGCVTILVGFLE